MVTGKVVGNIVSTQKHPKLAGYKLLLVELAREDETESPKIIVAVDTLGAGRGETVLLSTGSSARTALGEAGAPVDAVIIGIVDKIER
ncbi:MAG: EutN/CcmL family microcompartment protein [Bacillota bacterium]